jgi:hypothetical protein
VPTGYRADPWPPPGKHINARDHVNEGNHVNGSSITVIGSAAVTVKSVVTSGAGTGKIST